MSNLNTTTEPTNVPYLSPYEWVSIDDRVLVYQDPQETKSKGGIIIPETVAEQPLSGTVILTGEQTPSSIEIGDRVIYGKHAGQKTMPINGVVYFSVRPTEIIVCQKANINVVKKSPYLVDILNDGTAIDNVLAKMTT